MAANKLLILACALALSGLSAGCFGGGDSDAASAAPSGRRTRSPRGMLSFGGKKNREAAREEQARATAAALDGYTPESSMARDMRALQEQERIQTQTVARLAETRGTDPAEFAREQERLFTLRDKIRNYDAALQRFEMAARTRPARDADIPPAHTRPARDADIPPAIVPAEMFQDRAVRPASFSNPVGDFDAYQASRGGDRLEDYSRPDGGITRARVNLNDGRVEEGEQVLYRAEGNENLAALFENTGTLPGLDASAQRAAPPAAQPAGEPVPTRFAGAPVGRSNFGKTQRREADSKAAPEAAPQGGKPWENGRLFSEQPDSAAERQKPAVPNIYASRRQREEETLWPEGMAMVPPAEARSAPRPAQKTEVRLPAAPEPKTAAPAAPAKTSAPAPAKPAAAVIPDADVLDDEVFSPSMFLGGGL